MRALTFWGNGLRNASVFATLNMLTLLFIERSVEMNEFERRKRQAGMARPGTNGYNRSVACIPSANPDSHDARRTSEDLMGSEDPITRRIARKSLDGDDD